MLNMETRFGIFKRVANNATFVIILYEYVHIETMRLQDYTRTTPD